jgi:DNA-binding winged helix-turn-helix (wHTH) protein
MTMDARSPEVRLFGPFRFDIRDQRLFKDGKEIKLRRKPFAILRYLTAHPRRLVTQEEIVEAVWGKIAMSESLLRTQVSDVRRALGEGAVETVVGRGYRFLFAVEAEKPDPTSHPAKQVGPHPAPSNLAGRNIEIDTLARAFDAILEQKRQMVFVTGEPGIGKTTLVDAFLAKAAAPKGALIATGGCVEHLGAAEAYLPVLEALGALCRGAGDRRFVDLLARYAPTWVAQMPGLVGDEELAALALRIQGASQARMLRELAEALDVIAGERPLVLVLEDLQWSDASTVDLLAMLGARREPARVLVVATCRPGEITKGDGLARVIAELTARKQAALLDLANWSDEGTSEYLAQRFSGAGFPAELAQSVQRMTDGNPLFAVAIVDDLESRGMIRPSESAWELASSIADVENRRPETVRQLIDIQIDRLKSNEQRILEAASLIGVQFAIGSVAHALDLPADELDTTCEGLANDRRLLRFMTSAPWPDGSIQSHYSFAHALYRDAALRRVTPATKRAWHRRLAEGLEAAFGAAAETIAPELATHYDEAQVVAKAARYYGLAGDRAMSRFGRAEALAQFSRARALVATLPASDESDRAELAVLQQMGPALVALQGAQTGQLDQVFGRTAELARKLGDHRAVLKALLGLQRAQFLRGQFVEIERSEAEVAQVVTQLGDRVSAAMATAFGSAARLFRGQLTMVRGSLLEACDVLYTVTSDAEHAASVPIVGLWGGQLVILAWLEGAPDAALHAAAKMCERAEGARDPFHLIVALTMMALAHAWRREIELARSAARKALDLGRDGASPIWVGRAMSVHHWAESMLAPDKAQSYCNELSTAVALQLNAGPGGRTAFTPDVSAVYEASGYHERAVRELDEALAFVERTDERAWSSELHRFRGELLGKSDSAEAERSFKKALVIARGQGARSFELRAALSLAKLGRRGKKKSASLDDLRNAYASFTEGFETGDLVEAKALLDASN